jgi:hypothetical protein
MAKDEFDDPDQGKGIEELERRVKELGGSATVKGELAEDDPDLHEGFLKHILEFEEAPDTTHLIQLERVGVTVPDPATLSDQELTAKLWEIINTLARMRIFIEETDHLSDRELYTELWSDCLRQPTQDVILDMDSACHLPMLGSGSEDDTYRYLKYFADEQWRAHWLKDFPDYEMPEHEDPPYDRDRHIPRCEYGPPPDFRVN